MLLATGQVVKTTTDRDCMPFPKVDITTGRKSQNTLLRVRRWLLAEVFAEATARQDDYNHTQFSQLDARRLSQADLDALHMYVFGQIE